MTAADPKTTAEELKSLAATSTCVRVLRYLAENASTPLNTLETLSEHEHEDVRIGVTDNPSASFALLSKLALDENPNVRICMAENYNMPIPILRLLEEDENPFVAARAHKTLKRYLKLSESAPAQNVLEAVDQLNQRISLFIAEDNDFMRSLIARSLERHHRILVAGSVGNGHTAVEEIFEKKPDVVLMDIGMPGIDGVEATRMVKAQLPDVRVIMVTAHDSDDAIFNAFEAGADGYFLKTSSLAELATCITTVADGGAWIDPGISSTILKKCFRRHDAREGAEVALKVSEKDQGATLSLEILKYELDSLRNKNKLAEAIAVAKAAAAVAVAHFGRTSKQAAEMFALMAEIHYAKEDFGSSEKLLLQALQNREDLLESADAETDHVINMLARMSQSSGNKQQAELYYTWSLRIRERLGDATKAEEAKKKLNVLLSDAQ